MLIWQGKNSELRAILEKARQRSEDARRAAGEELDRGNSQV